MLHCGVPPFENHSTCLCVKFWTQLMFAPCKTTVVLHNSLHSLPLIIYHYIICRSLAIKLSSCFYFSIPKNLDDNLNIVTCIYIYIYVCVVYIWSPHFLNSWKSPLEFHSLSWKSPWNNVYCFYPEIVDGYKSIQIYTHLINSSHISHFFKVMRLLEFLLVHHVTTHSVGLRPWRIWPVPRWLGSSHSPRRLPPFLEPDPHLGCSKLWFWWKK